MEENYRPMHKSARECMITFARETWSNDGAEGETAHKLCDELEWARQRLKKVEADYADLTRRAAASARELGALRDLGPEGGGAGSLRAAKELLDWVTASYPPPPGKLHGLNIGRSGRLQLWVWIDDGAGGAEGIPLFFDDRDGDLDKGFAELVDDIGRRMGIWQHVREVSRRPLEAQLDEPCTEFQRQLKSFEAGEGPYPTSAPMVRVIREHFEGEQAAADDAERAAVLNGISYVMRQRRGPLGAMECRVRLGLAERFLNWYAKHTKLYIRGQQGKDWDEQRRLDAELAVALGPFLRQLVDEEVGVRLAEQHVGVDEAVLDRQAKAVCAWLTGRRGSGDVAGAGGETYVDSAGDRALAGAAQEIEGVKEVLRAAARGPG